MISIENPPSDPSSCSCSDQIPQPKNSSCSSNSCSKSSSSSSDEKKISSAASASDNKLAFVEEEEVDPLKSGLDESNPNPKFSIRDYVFGSRSKDISKNWPFSQENLHLCLKHGVKNLLPPFHPLDSVRNPSIGGCAIDEIVSSRDGESSDQIVSATADNAKCNPELALDFRNSNNNSLELVADLLVEGSKQRFELEIPPTSRKSDTTIQTTGKKCKLVVKFGPVVDPVSTSEDITVNNFMVSEAMSSKVCPVCKTFSSSSNTTLNAHIDQCLSGESTMKWTANPKVIKNRIKPRKTRLMVDIYKTAAYCTLEELDRRNGTNWATNSSFPAQEIEFHGELKEKERRLNTEFVETGHEGDVYIDTDGTKVRILSAPKIGVEVDDGARKLVKGKGSTNLTSKKRKKSHEEKHHKFLKLSPRRKKFCSPKSRHGFELRSNQEKKFSNEEDCENVDEQNQFQAQGERELDDAGTIKSWGCSRRSSHAKRAHGKGSTRFTETRISPVENDQSSLERRCVLIRTPSSSCSPISSPENSKQMDTSLCEPPVGEYGKHSLLRKRMAFQSGSSARNKAGSSTNNDVFGSSSKSRRFSSLKKNLLSVSRESMPNLKRNFPAIKKTQKHMELSQSNRLNKPLHDHSRHQSVMEDVTGKTALGSLMNVLKLKKRRGGIDSFKNEESIALKSVQLPARKNLESSRPFTTTMADTFGDGDSSRKEIEAHGERLATVGGNFSNPALDSESDSQQFVGVHQGSFSEAEEPLLSPELSLDDKDEMFYEDHIDKTIIGQDIGISAESDSKELGQGGYFAEVDPIPIPGPPGSFLPSPGGDMVSEDLQGNSSLTNSRVQSSDDHLDLADRDSLSDSPISATSNISNPTLTRSDSRSSEKFSVRSAAVEESFSPVQRTTSVVAERTSNLNDWRRVTEIFPEKGLPPSFKNDQPCCCSRKEGPPQTAYHESALLRRRNMESNKRSFINSNNFKSEELSVSNHPTSVPEKVVLPEVKFPVRNDCVAASPSSSNPVLRLMGKDLMVVKKDEDVSPQLRPSTSSAMVDHPNGQFQMVKAASSGDLPYEDYHSLRQVFPTFGQSHNEPEMQHIDFSRRLPNDFSNHVELKAPQTPIHASFPSTTSLVGGYMTSVDRYSRGGSHLNPAPLGRHREYNVVRSENNIGCRLPTDQQTRSNRGYGTPMACGRNAFSISNNVPTKEIIIIDDSPENETDLPSNHAMQCEGMMRSDAVSSPIPSHFHPRYNPRHVNSFYDYPPRGSFSYGGLPVFEDARFQNPVSREVNSSPAQWNPNSVAASLPSAIRVSSTMYYPPSFS